MRALQGNGEFFNTTQQVVNIVCMCVCVQMKGIVKQGVRCKDCGISCHKHCKDHVVVDCKKRKEKKSKCFGVVRVTLFLFCTEATKVRDRSATITAELYYDDDISLKERLARAETVS